MEEIIDSNIYDNEEFFDVYSKRFNRSLCEKTGASDWINLNKLLPPSFENLDVADLGCGFGYFSRWARDHGAKSVLACDLSENMLYHARLLTSESSVITYHQKDLENPELKENSLDLIFSSLVFHYVPNLDELFNHIFKALRNGGQLIFSMEHPSLTSSCIGSSKPTALGTTSEIKSTINSNHLLLPSYPLGNYFDEGKREKEWLLKGKFITMYHRKISTILNSLMEAGFILKKVDEFCPSADRDVDAIDLCRPRFLFVKCIKNTLLIN